MKDKCKPHVMVCGQMLHIDFRNASSGISSVFTTEWVNALWNSHLLFSYRLHFQAPGFARLEVLHHRASM